MGKKLSQQYSEYAGLHTTLKKNLSLQEQRKSTGGIAFCFLLNCLVQIDYFAHFEPACKDVDVCIKSLSVGSFV